MTGLYRAFVRPLLFSQESEAIHDRTLRMLGCCARHPLMTEALASVFGAPALPVDLLGLRFPNPVGLAAGMDKRAAAVPAWEALGFGHTELGGVTLHEQPGNEAPRMFRAIAEEALVNRMGFNNPGAEAMAQTLAVWRQLGRWPKHPVGMNLGKSKITPLEKAAEDYVGSFKRLREFADFFVVNVSSPNTPNLRQLQDKAALNEILAGLQEENGSTSQKPEAGIQKPVLVKIAPDLSFAAIDEILELVGPRNLAGLVATNTTITRPETRDSRAQQTYAETGGLSGKPLRERATACIRHVYRQTAGRLPIIGVGGIFNADDAWEKITAGASLVQIYTGLVYEGPGIARAIVSGLRERLDRAGLRNIGEAVGIDH
jgi:dihydroorotate dehydrogenase